MASFTTSREDKFPNGTSVAAYEVVGLGQTPASGAPPGSAVDTDTVTGGSFTFTGLDDSTEYIAYASSPDRYLRFSTPDPAAAGGSGLPAGGSIGDIVVNTGDGTGDWTTPTDPAAADIAFTPTGTIAATDVQAAIAEVASEAAGGGSGTPSGTEIPSDRSWGAWTFPPMPGLANYTLDTGYIVFAKIPVREAFTAGQIAYYKKDHGASLTAAYLGIYSSTGTLLGKTASLHTAMMSGGDTKDDLSGDPAAGVTFKALVAESGQSLALAAGSFVIGAVLCVGTTGYQTVRIDGYGLANAGLSALGLNAWRTTSGKTTLPATISGASREAYMIGPLFLALDV